MTQINETTIRYRTRTGAATAKGYRASCSNCGLLGKHAYMYREPAERDAAGHACAAEEDGSVGAG